jgi:hypothetical protein
MKYISLIVALLGISMLFALPQYVPTTTLAEDFGASWCTGCPTAWAGVQVLHSQTHPGEFISAKLFTESGDLSSPVIQDRFDYYAVIGIPAVIMNGKIRTEGSGDGIGDGSLYLKALNQFRYSSSPIKMNITSFTGSTGNVVGTVQMVSPTAAIADAQVVYYLLEDNVSDTDTHVVRSILYDDFALTGEGSTFNFNKTFTLNPSWNTANLWAIAAVQIQSKTIIQATSSLALPAYNFRAAMDWNPNIEGPANYGYTSNPLWFYNLGESDNYSMRIVVDYAPEGWYFNYCGEDGSCYPGDFDRPFSLAAGESVNYHLNLWIGAPGIAYFRFVITSPNLGTYSVPFRYKVEGVANDDPTLITSPMQLGSMYPNPVSQSAGFEITSDKSLSSSRIDIFNLKGQKVQSIMAENLVQGSNRITFNPASGLPNGVYFYRLAGSTAQSGKFILMR